MVLKVMILVFGIIGLFIYLVIVGANMSVTDEERKLEDEEQIKYLKEHRNKKVRR